MNHRLIGWPLQRGVARLLGLALLGASLVMGLAAHAAQEAAVVLVTRVQGTVSWAQGAGSTSRSLAPFVRLSPGARVMMSEGAGLQVTYLKSGRQETWSGKAQIAIGDTESKAAASAAAPTVKLLPATVLQALSRSDRVMGDLRDRQAMVRLRTVRVPDPVREAETLYAQMRGEAEEEDITPELVLLSRLDELEAHLRMGPALAEMQRRQPYNTSAVALHQHFTRLMQLSQESKGGN